MIDLEAAEEALSSDLLESITKRMEELKKAHDEAEKLPAIWRDFRLTESIGPLFEAGYHSGLEDCSKMLDEALEQHHKAQDL